VKHVKNWRGGVAKKAGGGEMRLYVSVKIFGCNISGAAAWRMCVVKLLKRDI